ncbi:MAG: hypothetical protein Q8P39_03385 [Candidatus Yanofskybacteria bacterium]|nr:hypothetical protein [Candidatus Yanofskybacteria bacterium]
MTIANFTTNIWKRALLIGAFLCFGLALSLFDQALFLGLGVFLLLSGGTLFFLRNQAKGLKMLFICVLCIHLFAVLAIEYGQIYPFGGREGDQRAYHSAATEISESFRAGNFSYNEIAEILEENSMLHSYPVFIGALYALTIPHVLIGKMLSLWFAAISALLAYALVREMKGSHQWGLLVGILVGLYPSYLYFSSLLIRESLVVSLALLVLLLMLRLFRSFSWGKFLVLYGIMGLLVHYRFYVGFIPIVVFLVGWLLFVHAMHWKKKVGYGLVCAILLGFLPILSGSGFGYYGTEAISGFLSVKSITGYRETYLAPEPPAVAAIVPKPAAAPEPHAEPAPAKPSAEAAASLEPPAVAAIVPKPAAAPEPHAEPAPEKPSAEAAASLEPSPSDSIQEFFGLPQAPGTGVDFSIVVPTRTDNPVLFVLNNMKTFSYATLGPFPWQFKYDRHLPAFVETIPWSFLFIFVVVGIVRSWKRYRPALLISLFALGVLGILSLFLSNFGIVLRIRASAIIVLLCFLPFAFKEEYPISLLRVWGLHIMKGIAGRAKALRKMAWG